MKLKLMTIAISLLVAVASCGQPTDTKETTMEASAPIQDIAAARPDAVKIAFQNDYVRVLRFDLEPGEALPPHSGKRRVVYSLDEYALDWKEGGEALGSRTWSTGDVHVHDAGVHETKNTGDTTSSFVVFERLDAPLPSAPMHEHGAELPAGAKSLVSDKGFQVLEVELQPGESQDLHHGGWRAIYSLSNYTIEWQEGEDVEQSSWSAGNVHWHEPAQHAARNTGDTVARWVVVGFTN